MRKMILVILVMLAGAYPARADLVFDSGYNTFDANDPYYDEVWVINDAHLDVLGGAMWKLELMHHATANIYSGDIDLLALNHNTVVNIYSSDINFLAIQDSTVVNIHGGTLDYFAAAESSLVYLYAYDVTYHTTGGLEGEGWIEGIYISNDTTFSFSFYNDTTYLHVIVVCGTTVDAEVEIAPRTLNLATMGKYIKCFIRLPEDYNVADVEPNSIVLEYDANEIEPEWLWFNEDKQVVMAKFNRADVCEILEAGDIDLTVTGHLVDGTCFEGTDTIRVIDKGHLRGGFVNSNSKIEDGIEYYIQTDKSLYRLGEHVEMLYRVTNLGDENVTFGYFALPVWNFWVEKNEEYIWRAVNGWYGTITEFILSPGESREFPAHDHPRIWNMRDKENNLVNVGEYSVIGGLYNGSGSCDYTKVAVPIRIVPKPAHASPKNK